MSDVEARIRDKAGRPSTTAAAEPERIVVRADLDARDAEGSFGRALAAAREARGLTQDDVAVQLRLHRRQVKAIEAEDLAALPEGPFVRGYVRNFARLVDLPAEPLLSLLNAKLRPTEPLRAQTVGSQAVSPIQRMPGEPKSGPWVLGGAVAALVVFAAFGWWAMRTEQQAPAAPVQGESAVRAAPETLPASSAAPSAEATATAAAASVASADQSVVVAEPPSSTALRLHFRERSWVEIRQADGAVLLSQNNPAGTVQTIDGVPPYALVIGNASKVDLEFGGKPVDLSTSAGRGDVARLRLE